MDILNRIFNRYPNGNDVARALALLLTSMSPYGWSREKRDETLSDTMLFSLDDAVDEMISTKIEQSLLYQINRFHSDDQVENGHPYSPRIDCSSP